ncbi:MAG: hypothetical protein DME23_20230 [Verrucomicrobia bacterium]|nr:MAG: hypothetical protein DME23_20230 [Verrucomicrobiota bacterium]
MLMVREFSGLSQLVFAARNLLSKEFIFQAGSPRHFWNPGRSWFLHNGAEAICSSFRGVN